jgi:PAS domain S-box-containing protein
MLARMQKDQLKLENLKKYASFLFKNHLQEVVIESIQKNKEVKIPLLKLFDHLTEEELFNLAEKGMGEYLSQIVEGTAIDVIKQSMEDWKADKLPGIPKNVLVASDITLIYYVRKSTLIKFLPLYTNDVNKALEIIQEIEEFYLFQETLAMQTYAEIQNEKIAKSEASLKEAQALAHTGNWEFNISTQNTEWSDELYRIYGLRKEDYKDGISSVIIEKYINTEDVKAYREKIRQSFETLESFNHEYRITRADGQVRVLSDQGYSKKEKDGVIIVKAITLDITDKKIAENKLKELNINLEERVERRTRELLQSEERFRFLAETVPNIVWTANSEGQFDYYNQRWYEYTGLTAEQTDSNGWGSVIYNSDIERRNYLWEESVRTGKDYQIEFRLKRADGAYRWFLGRALPLKNSEGSIVKWFGTATDIHDAKMTQQELAEKNKSLEIINRIGKKISAELELNKLVQEVTDATTQLSGAQFGAFFYNVINKKGESYTLYSISGVDRENFSKFPMPRNTEVFAPTFHGEGTVRVDDITKDHRYGKNAPYKGMPAGHLPVRSYLAVPVISRTGEVLGGLFYGHDQVGIFTKQAEEIVEGIAAQTAIAIDNSRLFEKQKNALESLAIAKEQLSSINVEISSKNEQLQKINNDLDSFIYTASHDLKAPISNIEGLINALIEHKWYEDKEVKGLLDMMGLSVEKFKKTIQELTEISKIQKTVPEDVEEIGLSEIFEEIKFSINNLISDADAKIGTDFSKCGSVKFSRKNLRSVLYNILSNAIKYRSPDRRAEVFVKTEIENDFVIISIKDNGLGISDANKGKVFTMFKRFHDHVEGTGVGLYIVKRIIDNAGGRILIDSGTDKGSTFNIYIKK